MNSCGMTVTYFLLFVCGQILTRTTNKTTNPRNCIPKEDISRIFADEVAARTVITHSGSDLGSETARVQRRFSGANMERIAKGIKNIHNPNPSDIRLCLNLPQGFIAINLVDLLVCELL